MLKNWKTYGLALLLLLAVGLLFSFATKKNSIRRIQNVKVVFTDNLSEFINAEKVNKLLIQSDAKVMNKQKSSINLQRLEDVLRSNEMVESAEVFLTLDDELEVQVTQRVPMVRIQKGSVAYYIDRQGLRMPLSSNYSARVPIVTGVKTPKEEQEVYQLIKIINEDSFYKKMIIGYKLLENGDYLLSTRVGKHKILLGRIDGTAEKLRKLKIFYKKEWNSEEMKQYKIVNIKYDHQVVCVK